jgi:RNA polymerase-binding transcription factor DksA
MLSQQFIEEMKQQLLAKKSQLEEDLSDLPAHTELGNSEDDNAEEIPVDEANQDVIAIMRLDLDKVNKALAKITAGNYGTDDDGQEISEARLRAMPWADKAL